MMKTIGLVLQVDLLDFSNVTTNDFDQIKNLDECPIVVLCVKTASGTGFPANTIIIYENANGAGLEEVGRFKNHFVIMTMLE